MTKQYTPDDPGAIQLGADSFSGVFVPEQKYELRKEGVLIGSYSPAALADILLQMPAFEAERDRLKAINAELLETVRGCREILWEVHLDEPCEESKAALTHIDDVIDKATAVQP